MRAASIGPRRPAFAATPALAYALACLAASAVAVSTAGDTGPAVWWATGTVAAILGLELATSTPYERGRTMRPVRRLVGTAGAGLLGASSFAWLSPSEVRWAGATVLAAGVVVATGAVTARVTQPARKVLLVGGRVGVGQLISQWAECPDIDVRGVCLPEFYDESAQEIGLVPILGSLDDVAAVAHALEVDEVVVAPGPLLSGYHVRRLSWSLENMPVELSVVAEVDGVVPRRITPRVLGRRTTLSVRPGRRTTPELWVKGLVDRLVGGLLLILLSPVFLVVAALIRSDTPGSALFRQTRIGLDGKPFTIYKFRTMLVDAEARLAELRRHNEGAGPLFKMAVDPRTTAVGRILRRTSIDELPQLINVIRGEMSLVGPRPGLPLETMMYDEWVHRRLRVRPGMTGAWQVGGRSNLSWTDSVRLDIDYVDNATLRDDLRIAMKTARVVIGGDGAL